MTKKITQAGLLAAVLMSAAGAEGSAGGSGGGAPADAPKDKEPKAPGVGDVAKQLIRDGKTNEEVLAAIKEQFPEAKTSMASINWYRNKLRADGEKVPTARELKADTKAEDKAKKDAEKAEKKAKAEAEKAEKKAKAAAEKAEAKAKAIAEKEAAKNAAKTAAVTGKKAEGGAAAGEGDKAKGQDFLK